MRQGRAHDSTVIKNVRADSIRGHVAGVALAVGLLVVLLDFVLVDVGVVLVHVADEAERLGEERGVGVTVASVRVGRLERLILVDYG